MREAIEQVINHIDGWILVLPGPVRVKGPNGDFPVPGVLIIGKRKEGMDEKTSLNDVLRDFDISVKLNII